MSNSFLLLSHSFLRPFTKYKSKTVYALFTMLVKMDFMMNTKTLKHFEKLSQSQQRRETTCKKYNC